MTKKLQENNFLSLDFKFDTKDDKASFIQKVNDLAIESMAKKPNPEEILQIQRKKSDEIEVKNVECFYKELGLELLSIFNENDLKMNISVETFRNYGHTYEGIVVELIDGEESYLQLCESKVRELIYEADLLSNFLDSYTSRAPHSMTHQKGIDVCSSNIITKELDLGITLSNLSEENKSILSDQIFQELPHNLDGSDEVFFDLSYFFDNENLYEDDNYPEMVYNIKKLNVEDSSGYKRNFSNLMLRIEKNFSKVKFIHFDDVDFTNEIEKIRSFFEFELKKILLKYKYI